MRLRAWMLRVRTPQCVYSSWLHSWHPMELAMTGDIERGKCFCQANGASLLFPADFETVGRRGNQGAARRAVLQRVDDDCRFVAWLERVAGPALSRQEVESAAFDRPLHIVPGLRI